MAFATCPQLALVPLPSLPALSAGLKPEFPAPELTLLSYCSCGPSCLVCAHPSSLCLPYTGPLRSQHFSVKGCSQWGTLLM